MRRRLTSRLRKPTLKKKKTETRPKKRMTRALSPPLARRRAEYLTPTEAADRLLVATVTLRLWANKGLLPSVTTLGGHRRFRAEDVEAFAALHQPKAGRRRAARVLIIDDDRDFSRYLARMIAANAPGVVVDVANDGFSAGLKCQASRPDVVTLDLQMPDMDGFEVCAMLRTMFGRSIPRIVALTGFPSMKNVRRILAAGADACLPKGCAVKVLLREMRLASAS
jgi:excisionase family DNA binding protein